MPADLMASLCAVRQALFELPPGATLAVLAGMVGSLVLAFAVGTQLVLDAVDEPPPGRHRMTRSLSSYVHLCHTRCMTTRLPFRSCQNRTQNHPAHSYTHAPLGIGKGLPFRCPGVELDPAEIAEHEADIRLDRTLDALD